jgi:hypothetical protein
MDLADLNTRGWTVVDGVSSQDDLVALGSSLGLCVRTPNGELVKVIRRIPRDQAPPGSQSALYGSGPFPLHTDTVFWPLPVRYVLLRGYGDTRRPTTLRSFAELASSWDEDFYGRVRDSVWRVRAGSNSFYCSMRFRHGDSLGWRYDADLMIPANGAAARIDPLLRSLAMEEAGESITWSGDQAVVISNWIAVHGRGTQPPDEGERIVERLYVR